MCIVVVGFQQGGLGKPRVDINGLTRELSRIGLLVGACGRVQMICGTRRSSVAQIALVQVLRNRLVEFGSK